MFLHLILWALCSYTVLAASLPQRSERIGKLETAPISSSNLLSPAIPAPSSSNNTSLGNVVKIACDPRRFGRDLKVNSCRSVFRYLHEDENQFRFAERDSGVPLDVPLPLRTYSSEKPHTYFSFRDGIPRYFAYKYRPSHTDASTTDDGLCFIQPVLKQGAISGLASSTEMGQAASRVLQICVIERGMGGIASHIGGDNKVDVAVSDYKPNVKCDSSSTPGPPWKSCVAVLTSMRANQQIRIFGSDEEPNVDETLPRALIGADEKCQLSIDIDGPATLGTWYEIWESATAIAMMCTRSKSKGGKAKGIGLAENIRLELSVRRPDPDKMEVANVSTESVAGAGIVLQYFDPVSPQAGFDLSSPFELLTGDSQDNGSVVTLPGDSDE